MRGAVKKLQITRMDTCETCHGTGAVGTPQTCPTCNGSGSIQQTAGKMRFNVPCNRCGGTGKLRTPCRTAAAKGGCGERKRSTCGFRRCGEWWARARAGKRQCGTLGAPAGDLYLARGGAGRTSFSSAAEMICTRRCRSRCRKLRWARRWKCRRSTGVRLCGFLRGQTAGGHCG